MWIEPHPSIIYNRQPLEGQGWLEPIPADFGPEAGYTLGRLLVHHRAGTETNHS